MIITSREPKNVCFNRNYTIIKVTSGNRGQRAAREMMLVG
jgi:hypothetical protein